MTDDMLHVRIHAEYNEMPGLRLTLAQAARLFNLERVCCEQVLQRLVNAGALWSNGREFLARDSGRRHA